MKITFSCRCGQRLQVRQENRGKKVRCPSCNAVVPVPEADEADAEVYALVAKADGAFPGTVIGHPDHFTAAVVEPASPQLHLGVADGIAEVPADRGAALGSSRAGAPDATSALLPDSLGTGSPSPLCPPPPLPGESRPDSAPVPSRRLARRSRVERVASRALMLIGWLCIAVAGFQFSVFAGSLAWSFKSGLDRAAHDASVRKLEQQITALDERILRRQVPGMARRRFAGVDADALPDLRQAEHVVPRKIDPDEAAREKLQEGISRLRMSKPPEFTLTAAFAMATGFAILLFWLAGTSGLLAGSIGCVLLRLTRR